MTKLPMSIGPTTVHMALSCKEQSKVKSSSNLEQVLDVLVLKEKDGVLVLKEKDGARKKL